MKNLILFILLASLCLGFESDYFQQHVAYDIEVTLDDSAHTLDAYEKIIYTNKTRGYGCSKKKKPLLACFLLLL